MRSSPASVRFAFAGLCALLLSLRLLGSAGCMPQVDHGSLTIIACPDADAGAPLAIGMAGGHHTMGKDGKSQCPYAAAAALGAVAPDPAPLLVGVLLAPLPLVGRALVSMEPLSTRDRPPAIGPPIPA